MAKTLSLTPQERLQLHQVIGLQEGRAADMRLFHNILGKLEFSDAEKQDHNVRARSVSDTRVYFLWDESFGATNIEFSTEEYSRMKAVVEGWPKFTSPDWQWLGPLLEKFD